MIHLREKDKENLIEIALECFSKPFEIWAYGSRVDGSSHEASDLDLVIRGEGLEKLDINELADFVEKVRESNIPIIVQAFDWKRIPEAFHEKILEKHEVVFSNISECASS